MSDSPMPGVGLIKSLHRNPKMSVRKNQPKPSDRVGTINAVKDALGFFTLVVLVVEAVLGVLALKTQGSNQLVVIYSMVGIISALILFVGFLSYFKPENLFRTASG